MVASSVEASRTAASALGEITSSGRNSAATATKSSPASRAAASAPGLASRPALELRIELTPVEKPTELSLAELLRRLRLGATTWATLFRGVNGMNSLTTSQRLQSPDYLEIRARPLERTFLFTGGRCSCSGSGGRAWSMSC